MNHETKATRRHFIRTGLAALAVHARGAPQVLTEDATRFQLACMTLPYSAFSFARALSGIQSAGFTYVAWGTTHLEKGEKTPVLAKDATPAQAKARAAQTRDAGLNRS